MDNNSIALLIIIGVAILLGFLLLTSLGEGKGYLFIIVGVIVFAAIAHFLEKWIYSNFKFHVDPTFMYLVVAIGGSMLSDKIWKSFKKNNSK